MPNHWRNDLTVLFFMYIGNIFANCSDKLNSLLNIIEFYSTDVNMNFGVDKYAIIHIKEDKLLGNSNDDLTNEQFIQGLEGQKTYKYQGIREKLNVNQNHLLFRNKYFDRVKAVLKIKLDGKGKKYC